jgi:hypothetical protein
VDESLPPLCPSTRRLIVPFTGGLLRAETRAAVPEAQFVNVGNDPQAYWRLLKRLWAGTSFMVIEHDIVPTQDQIDELWDCPQEWCAAPYDMGEIETTALGFVRFGFPLLQRTADLVGGIIESHRSWNGLDSMIVAELHRRGASEHVHLPAVQHLHEYTPEPRRRKLAKLHYVGDGTRFLNGVPASDFETWDAETIAICLDSHLYTDVTPKRNKVESPEYISKFIPFTTEPHTEKEI